MSGPILVLAGTAEGRCLVTALSEAGRPVIAALAGATEDPAPLGVETLRGGFGGAAGLAETLRRRGIAALIDATHPFAERISANAAEAASATGTPRLRLQRPEWRGGWRRFASLEQAVAALPPDARVFAATGRQTLDAYRGRNVVARVIDPPAGAAPEGVRLILGRPPVPLAEEIALMERERITHLVAKNSGGPARAKLDAAEALVVEVLMIDRPAPPPGPTVETVAQALEWLDRLSL
jgi:precorrin-6A/cobalt-precorrin-6A reductase